MTLKPNPNFRDPVTLEAILKTVFSDYDPNRADLTGTPNILGAADQEGYLGITFYIRSQPYAFGYDYNEELAYGYRLKPDEECGSDDDPDWELCTPHVFGAFLAFIAACKEGLL